MQKSGSWAPKLRLAPTQAQSDHQQLYCRQLLVGSQQVRLQWKQSYCQSRCCQNSWPPQEEQLLQKLLNQLHKPDPECFGWRHLWQLQQQKQVTELTDSCLDWG